MSDLDRRYAELVTAGRVGALPPPAELRRRADRRARVRATVAVAGAVLAVAGTVATANAVLVGTDRAGPYVGTTPSPDGTPTGTPTPSPTPSVDPPPPTPSVDPPAQISDRAFFVQPENTMKEGPRSLREGAEVLPELCGADFASDRSILDRVTMGHVYKRPQDTADYVPQGILYQTITSYRGTGAAAFMTQLAEVVRDCPTGNEGDLTARYRLLDTGQRADGTLLIEVRTGQLDIEGNPSGTATNLVSVVRVGPVVTVLRDAGWEGAETVPDLHDEFTRLAVLAIEDWLS
ncbi:hypothetical protein O7627_35970 [Solwaraspora sp. WMMD1047]|uniref:hypothetical protein n=1 Tax=Solwaraspora sp. WMMD1047 TaxID=3016102 RepID=UPI002417D46A|nr:hypothetical protein [Solwaraspora sp. WMMD1047]MDG4834668.1 hypothetical protein [Solwaraspora sp. WMMD1047]